MYSHKVYTCMPLYACTHTAGHTDQNKHSVLTQNQTAPTGITLFPSLADQDEGFLEGNAYTEVQLGSVSSCALAHGLPSSCPRPISPVAGIRIYKPPRLEPQSSSWYSDSSHYTHTCTPGIPPVTALRPVLCSHWPPIPCTPVASCTCTRTHANRSLI